jgi:hypothetical protein
MFRTVIVDIPSSQTYRYFSKRAGSLNVIASPGNLVFPFSAALICNTLHFHTCAELALNGFSLEIFLLRCRVPPFTYYVFT